MLDNLKSVQSTADREKWNADRKFRRQWKGSPRTCIECQSTFTPTQKKQLYCSRTCYRSAVHRKEKMDMENGRPWVRCQNKTCNALSRCEFAPKVDLESWLWLRCPKCEESIVSPVEREIAYLEMGKSVPKIGYSKGAKFIGFGKFWNYVTADDFPKPPAENFNDGGEEYLSE